MTKDQPGEIVIGALVKTTKSNTERREWTEEAWVKRKWGVRGRVVAEHNSHGLCYDVSHEDGSTGSYDPSELEVAPAPANSPHPSRMKKKKRTPEEEELAFARRLMRRKPLVAAPKSYRNRRRPPLHEAIRLEGEALKDATLEKLGDSLTAKGYFSPRPRPWHLGFRSRGLGRGDYAVIDRFGDPVAENVSREDAELIIRAVSFLKRRRTRR